MVGPSVGPPRGEGSWPIQKALPRKALPDGLANSGGSSKGFPKVFQGRFPKNGPHGPANSGGSSKGPRPDGLFVPIIGVGGWAAPGPPRRSTKAGQGPPRRFTKAARDPPRRLQALQEGSPRPPKALQDGPRPSEKVLQGSLRPSKKLLPLDGFLNVDLR